MLDIFRVQARGDPQVSIAGDGVLAPLKAVGQPLVPNRQDKIRNAEVMDVDRISTTLSDHSLTNKSRSMSQLFQVRAMRIAFVRLLDTCQNVGARAGPPKPKRRRMTPT